MHFIGTRKHKQLFLILLWALTGEGRAGGQIPSPALTPLPVEATLHMRSFAPYLAASVSPDGKWVAYVAHREGEPVMDAQDPANQPAWAVGTEIYVQNLGTGQGETLRSGISSWLPAWSPDGRHLAFLSTSHGGAHPALWVWDPANHSQRQVSNIEVKMFEVEDQIQWFPDSKRVLLPVRARRVAVNRLVKSAESRTDAAITPIPMSPATVLLYSSHPMASAEREAPRSDPWDLDLTWRGLAVVNTETGASQWILAGSRITKVLLSPDGKHAAYASAVRFEEAASQQILYDLISVDIVDGNSTAMASSIRLNLGASGFTWSPDSLHIAFRAGGMEERAYDCYIADVSGGEPRNLTEFSPADQRAPYRPSPPLWDDHSATLYLIKDGALWSASSRDKAAEEVGRIPNRRISYLVSQTGNQLWSPDGGKSTIVITHDDSGKQDGFYRIDLTTGQNTRILEKQQCYTCVFGLQEYLLVSDQRVAFFAEDAQHPSELWATDPGFHDQRQVSRLNSELDGHRMGSARLVEWFSDDGVRLQGALLLPTGYEAGKRYPLIVYVYGGANLSNQLNEFGFGAMMNLQLFATRGYAVFLPDSPQALGTPMLDLAKTVLPGVSKVIAMGIGDSERLGVMGHSYGGYSTLALIAQTNRFKAAMAADGFADAISAYGEMGPHGEAFQVSNSEHGQVLMGVTPWESRERYEENSPFFYLDRIHTPILLVHGAADDVIAPFLSDQTFVGLRRLNKVVEYAKYENEKHSPSGWRYSNQLDLLTRTIAWFDQYLLPEHSPVPNAADGYSERNRQPR